jgi:N-acetylmuramoyl-L-alanine amidase
VREREVLRAASARLAEHRVYVAATPNLAALGDAVARGLIDAGAESVLDTTGGDDSLVVAGANRFGADLFLALRTGDATGARCAYFASGRFRSEAGFAVASAITEQLGRVLPDDAETTGKAYASLRETTMPAVVCELLHDGDVAAMRVLVAHAGDAARAIVRGIQNGVERPALDPD